MVNQVQLFLKYADQACDYIPVLSSFSNAFDLFMKHVVIDKTKVANNHYYEHLNDKTDWRCIVLATIPLVGNLAIAIYDIYHYANIKEDAFYPAPPEDEEAVNTLRREYLCAVKN